MPFLQFHYHFVWGTKNREPLIGAALAPRLHEVIAAKARELGAHVYGVGGVEDHVHLVASVPPALAVSRFVAQVKGVSSHWVNHQPDARAGFRWQAEYGATTFSTRQLARVVRYVCRQREHHDRGPLVALFERVSSDISEPQ
jgi:REP element-mobilizing transposase RayT